MPTDKGHGTMNRNSALTFTERQARRLRDKCGDGLNGDTCATLVRGILGDDTPPLTRRQAEQVAAAAALHFSTSDCARCPAQLATLPPWLVDRAERKPKTTRRDERGLAVCLARLKLSCDAARARRDAGDHGGAS